MYSNLLVSKPFSECTAPRLKCVVLTHPWTRLDLYLGGWVGTELFCTVPVRILKAAMMGMWARCLC